MLHTPDLVMTPKNRLYEARTGPFVACFIRPTSICLGLHRVDNDAILRADPAATSGIAPAPSSTSYSVLSGGITVITVYLNTVFSRAPSMSARCAHGLRDGTNVISRVSL